MYRQFTISSVHQKLNLLTKISKDPAGNDHFFMKDIYGNIWEIKNQEGVFRKKEKSLSGGVLGTVIGVKDMDASLKVYQEILQYDEIVYDETGVFDDYKGIPGGDKKFRRVLLRHSDVKQGAFSPFFRAICYRTGSSIRLPTKRHL